MVRLNILSLGGGGGRQHSFSTVQSLSWTVHTSANHPYVHQPHIGMYYGSEIEHMLFIQVTVYHCVSATNTTALVQ